jgi:ribosomal protein S18 acetylase RimI-like enzyme
MEHIRDRTYAGDADFYKVQDLLIESYAVTKHPFYNWAVDGWQEERFVINQQDLKKWESNIHLWDIEGESGWLLVGAVICGDMSFDIQIHPRYRQIEDNVFNWIEGEYLTNQRGIKEVDTISVDACGHVDWNHALAHRGYLNRGPHTFYFQMSLGQRSPGMDLPDGYSIRNIRYAVDEDLEQRIEVFHQTYPTRHELSIEQLRSAERQASSIREDLDLAVVAPDGRFAAICTAWIDQANQIGFLDPISTLPDHRRRGFARALMVEAFSRLDRLGVTDVFLRTENSNIPAHRLYESVGMFRFDAEYRWGKEVPRE